MAKTIKLSILAGVMISIGCTVSLSCISQNLRWLGALLFSVGLFSICLFEFNLFTGKVGYIAYNFKDTKYIGKVLVILVFNLITAFFVGMLCSYVFPDIVPYVKELYDAKLSSTFFKLLASGFFCGILMFLGVDSWRRGLKIGVFIAIPVFVLARFDHSIANSFYNGAANGFNAFTLKNLGVIVSVILGNSLGGMLIPLLTRTYSKKASEADESKENDGKKD